MLHRKLKTTAFIAFVLLLSSVMIPGVYGQDCPDLGRLAVGQELCIHIWESFRTGVPVGPIIERRGARQIDIQERIGSYDVDIRVELREWLVPAPAMAITVRGTVTRTGTENTFINMNAKGGLSTFPLGNTGSMRVVGNSTGASIIELGFGGGVDRGYNEPVWFPYLSTIKVSLPYSDDFDEIRTDLPLMYAGSVGMYLNLLVDITTQGDIVNLPGSAGAGIGVENPGGIDESCLGVPTHYIPLCEGYEGIASNDTPVFYMDLWVPAQALFFHVPEAGFIDITLVPQGAWLYGALFSTGNEVCSEFIDDPLYPPDEGATYTRWFEPGTYYMVCHPIWPGPDVPFYTFIDYRGCGGRILFSAPTYNVEEDVGDATITVLRADGGIGPVSVDYNTIDGSAQAGKDYTPASGTLNWDDGDSSPKTFQIPIIRDFEPEDDETVNLELKNPTGGAALGDPSTAELTINANHAPSLDDILGTWSTGVWYRISETGSWFKTTTPAQMIAAGDIDGDNTDDLIGVWSSGLWVKYSSSGSWAKLSTTLPTDIASGDMNGDGRDDILGVWPSGVWYRISETGSWFKMTTPAQMIAAGDLDHDGIDDLIGVWSSGLWVKKSCTNSWSLVTSSRPSVIASGDMNGDRRDDVLGTWSSGVWYKDSITGTWVKMSTPATQIAAGDIDGDGKDDLIGTWSSGLWVKNSSTTSWQFICTSLPIDIDAGLFSTGSGAGVLSYDAPIVGVFAEGPGNISDYEDLSSEGPGGSNFVYQKGENLELLEKESVKMMGTLGPGEPGFRGIEQKNLIPGKKTRSKQKRIK